MLDGWARGKIDPGLRYIANGLNRGGIGANAVTLVGLALGLGAALAITYGALWVGLGLILFSRLCDGLDGAVARIRGGTDFGGFLDIVLDFAFYGAIPLGFALLNPAANAISAAVLIFSFYVNGASFLAYAVMAEKRKMMTRARGRKALFFTTGLAEAGETLLVFVLMCLLPQWFPILALAFAAITLYTAIARIFLAARNFA